MKITALIFIVLLTSTLCFAETVSLTKDQFQNIDVADKVLRAKYAQYKGFNGSSDKLEVYGISADSFMKEVVKMKSADEINSEKEVLKSEEELITKRPRKLAIDSLKAEGVILKTEK